MAILGEQIAREILAAEAEFKVKLEALRKAHDLLKVAAGRIEKKPWPFRDTRKLLSDLSAHTTGVAKDDVQKLQERLKMQLDNAAKSYERAFVDELVVEAGRANMPAGNVSGSYFLGPFRLTLDFAKETGVLGYADQPVASPMPLDAVKLVTGASALVHSLLTAPSDLMKLANEFDEAIRVALSRSRKPTEGRELRCPLPELHREMTLLRQDRSRAITSSSFREYPLIRFVVETKTLVQSEQNMTASRRFRLETAVIENTKNPKKSVFIPTDLQCGYGIGTYFQAIVLVNETR